MKLTVCEANGCSLFAIPGEKYCRYCKTRSRTKPDYLPSDNPYNLNSQIELFKSCWSNREHKCFVTGQILDRFEETTFFLSIFAHVLRKSAFLKWRLNPENIVLLSPNYKGFSIHKLFDDGVFSEIKKFESETGKSFENLFLMELRLFREYESEHGKVMPLRRVTKQYLNLK